MVEEQANDKSVADHAQKGHSRDLQAIPARKFTRSRKPPAIKTAVIAKRAQGQDKTSIANDLGITRNTVRAIINESDVDRHLEANQAASLDLIPEAIRVASYRLKEKNSEVMAIKVLENSIWPLNVKRGKAGDQGLVFAIQNLMGNVQVIENKQVVSTTPQPATSASSSNES